MAKNDTVAEDLAIQHTLSLTVEERLELLANLIVAKIEEDRLNGGVHYRKIVNGEYE